MVRGEERALLVSGRRRFPWGGMLVALLAAGAVYAHSQLVAQPLWTVRAISVEGNRSISRDDLLNRLGLRPGLPWWRVGAHRAARLRAEAPRIESLGISWRWPRDLLVSVHERESCLRILGPRALEVAPDGVVLEPSEALDPTDLPLLTGALPPDLSPGRRCTFATAGPGWNELLELSRSTPELWKAISEIHFVGGTDFQIFLRDGRKVILWETDINRELRQQVTRILAELRQQGVDDAVIDLRFRDQAVVRLPEAMLADTAAESPVSQSTASQSPAAGSTAPSARHRIAKSPTAIRRTAFAPGPAAPPQRRNPPDTTPNGRHRA